MLCASPDSQAHLRYQTSLWYPPDFSGHLLRQDTRGTWKFKYFVLRGSVLFWFPPTSPSGKMPKQPKGHIQLEGALVEPVAIGSLSDLQGLGRAAITTAEAPPGVPPWGIAVEAGPLASHHHFGNGGLEGPRLILAADSRELRDLWLTALDKAAIPRPDVMASQRWQHEPIRQRSDLGPAASAHSGSSLHQYSVPLHLQYAPSPAQPPDSPRSPRSAAQQPYPQPQSPPTPSRHMAQQQQQPWKQAPDGAFLLTENHSPSGSQSSPQPLPTTPAAAAAAAAVWPAQQQGQGSTGASTQPLSPRAQAHAAQPLSPEATLLYRPAGQAEAAEWGASQQTMTRSAPPSPATAEQAHLHSTRSRSRFVTEWDAAGGAPPPSPRSQRSTAATMAAAADDGSGVLGRMHDVRTTAAQSQVSMEWGPYNTPRSRLPTERWDQQGLGEAPATPRGRAAASSPPRRQGGGPAGGEVWDGPGDSPSQQQRVGGMAGGEIEEEDRPSHDSSDLPPSRRAGAAPQAGFAREDDRAVVVGGEEEEGADYDSDDQSSAMSPRAWQGREGGGWLRRLLCCAGCGNSASTGATRSLVLYNERPVYPTARQQQQQGLRGGGTAGAAAGPADAGQTHWGQPSGGGGAGPAGPPGVQPLAGTPRMQGNPLYNPGGAGGAPAEAGTAADLTAAELQQQGASAAAPPTLHHEASDPSSGRISMSQWMGNGSASGSGIAGSAAAAAERDSSRASDATLAGPPAHLAGARPPSAAATPEAAASLDHDVWPYGSALRAPSDGGASCATFVLPGGGGPSGAASAPPAPLTCQLPVDPDAPVASEGDKSPPRLTSARLARGGSPGRHPGAMDPLLEEEEEGEEEESEQPASGMNNVEKWLTSSVASHLSSVSSSTAGGGGGAGTGSPWGGGEGGSSHKSGVTSASNASSERRARRQLAMGAEQDAEIRHAVSGAGRAVAGKQRTEEAEEDEEEYGYPLPMTVPLPPVRGASGGSRGGACEAASPTHEATGEQGRRSKGSSVVLLGQVEDLKRSMSTLQMQVGALQHERQQSQRSLARMKESLTTLQQHRQHRRQMSNLGSVTSTQFSLGSVTSAADIERRNRELETMLRQQ